MGNAWRKWTIVINDLPPTWNTVINISKRHWYLYSKLKSDWKKIVTESCKTIPLISNPVRVTYTFILPNNRRRDLDNFCIKVLNDGFTFLPDDNFKFIEEIVLKYCIQRGKRQIIIDIEEMPICQQKDTQGGVNVKNVKLAELSGEVIIKKTKQEYLRKTDDGSRINTKRPSLHQKK